MGTISRDRFVRLFGAARVETASLTSDPRTAGADLEAADFNRDGRVSGEAEAGALFDSLDRSDGTVDANLTLTHARGTTSRAAPLFDAVATMSRKGALLALREPITSPDNGILLVGARSQVFAEATALRERTRVTLITDSEADDSDVVRLADGRVFDLAITEQLRRFVWTFGLPTARAAQIIALLQEVELGARREVGELARVWATAEHGAEIPRRLMISGHAVADIVFGDSNSERIYDRHVIALAALLPRAAAQIEHLHFAACQHGYESRMELVRAAFPNLVSLFGYGGSAPAFERAIAQERVWESATHDLPADPRLSRGLFSHMAGGTMAAVWTRSGGYDGPHTREYFDLQRALTSQATVYADYLVGTRVDDSPMAGFLYERYQLLNQYTTHMDAFWRMSESEREAWEAERHQVLCLRYYTSVAQNFARAYAREIAAGYEAAHLTPPNFAVMTRAEALASITAFRAATSATSGPAAELAPLLDAFYDLRRPVIRESWA